MILVILEMLKGSEGFEGEDGLGRHGGWEGKGDGWEMGERWR